MKKLMVAILSLAISAGAFAEFYSLESLKTMGKAQADSAMKELGIVMDQTFNSGLGAVMNVGFAQVGAQMIVTPFEKTGVLSGAPVEFMPMPYVFAGVSLFGITPFARAMVLPMKSGGNYPTVWGVGLGYEIDLLPVILTATPAVTYHSIMNVDNMSVDSVGLHLQVKGSFLILSPFANIGYTFNKYSTEVSLLGQSAKYTYEDEHFHLSAGVKILLFFAEVTFSPSMSYTGGIAIGF
jgi:hypothetical protein